MSLVFEFFWRRRFWLASGLCLASGLVCAADDDVPSPLLTHRSAIALRHDPGVEPRIASDMVSPPPMADTLVAAGPLRTDPLPTEIALAVEQAPDAMPSPGTISEGALAKNDSARSADSVSASLPPTMSPTPNATINLINLMVKRNLISRDDADDLIRQAQEEADVARASSSQTRAEADRALAAQSAPLAAPIPPSTPENGDDEVRVTYVPDVVKQQITDQVTQNVMEQTRQEHMADTIAASQVPEWVHRVQLTGDIRLRYEDDQFPSGNALGNFTNFNSINTSASGFNINTTTPTLPQYDADRDRERFRLRARIGAGIDLGQGFTAGIRIATGSDDTPTTENQTLGLANGGQGGDFAKYNIWLDRAFLRYDWSGNPDLDASLTVGRFDNPFFNTSMMWADDLGFDGIVAKGSYKVASGVTPFVTAGGFPVFNTDFNFSTNQAAKFDSEDKYLFAGQAGAHWEISKDFNFLGAVGIYDFENIQGKVSDPIFNAGINTGDTDDSRPSFAQNGNTYIALRDYEDTSAIPGTTVENQYYGLASKFRVVSLTADLEYTHFAPFRVGLTGEYIKNISFDRNAIINGGPSSDPGPQNNTTSANPHSFDGGDNGYLVHLDLGNVTLTQLWDWNVRLSYRYVETDATVDAFTDADFGAPLYGTNLKGYTIGGNLGLSSRVWAGLRYMSADNVSGPIFHSDLIQFDLNAKF
jgi:hypothetical protein